MKIPKDVSGLRRKIMLAAAARKRGVPAPVKPNEPVQSDDRVKKARQEAINARHKARDEERSSAEKDVRIQELQAALDDANSRLTEAEPAAKRWNEYSHKKKEMLVAELPKELQREARNMDVKHLEMFVSNYTGGQPAGTPGGKTLPSGTKIGSLKEAEKAEQDAYNEFMDGVKAGTIKIDKDGKVLA